MKGIVRIVAVGSVLVMRLVCVAAAQTEHLNSSAILPQTLDIRRFLRERFISPNVTTLAFQSLVGVQEYDGLPFQIEGRGWLYGRKEAERLNMPEDSYPDFIGIDVGHRFEELHLLHACRWQEGEGQTIAIVRLNYSDGTFHEMPIKYGAQVRDWQRMPSEEYESMSDAQTKIVWRGTPVSRIVKSTVRLFKTRVDNPSPEKTVVTIDFVSTKRLAAYDLVAATIANHDSKRSVTPPVKPPSPERKFSRAITIHVVNQTGKPVAGALVDPGMTVDKVSVIALPQYTSTNGDAVIRYPGLRTTSLSIQVEKAGYNSQVLFWNAKRFGNANWQQALELIVLMKGFVPQNATLVLLSSNSLPLQLPLVR